MRISNIIAFEMLYFWPSFFDVTEPLYNLEESLSVGVGVPLLEVGVGGNS